MEALQTDNITAIRHLGREAQLDTEALLVHLWESAGVVYATKKEPNRSEFFNALLVLGKELDSPAIAWAILERNRREEIANFKRALR